MWKVIHECKKLIPRIHFLPFSIFGVKIGLIIKDFCQTAKSFNKKCLRWKKLHNLGYPKKLHDRFHIITKVPLMTKG